MKCINLLKYLLALGAGALVHLSMAPYDLWPMSLIGLYVFTMLICRQIGMKETFLLAMAFGIGMFGTGVSWVYVSIHTYGGIPAALSVFLTFGFAVFLSLLFAVPWLPFAKLFTQKPSASFTSNIKFLAFPAFWLINEWLRGWAFTGFPWLYLGYGQTHSPLSGWIPILGATGTGLLIALSCSILAYISSPYLRAIAYKTAIFNIDAHPSKRSHRLTLRPIGFPSISLPLRFLTALILIWGIGIGFKNYEWTKSLDRPVPITLIQPNIPLADKWDSRKSNEILDILNTLSQPYWEPGLVIWPEAAIPYIGYDAMRYADSLDRVASISDTALITGLLTYDGELKRHLNSIIGVGKASSIYNKQRLVPFGEYIPLERWLKNMMESFNFPTSFIHKGSAHQEPLQFEFFEDQFYIAPIICYEIAYANLVRKLSNQSNLLVTLSNDAWFGSSIGPHQHMQIAQTRALENQKPLARATNNGITALVDFQGRISKQIPQFKQTYLHAKIEGRSGLTPYAKIGDRPLLLLCFILIFILSIWEKIKLAKESL